MTDTSHTTEVPDNGANQLIGTLEPLPAFAPPCDHGTELQPEPFAPEETNPMRQFYLGPPPSY